LGNEVLNGQDRLLKAFRDLTGSDAAFLMIHDNKVYRLATLLKDKDGKPMNGVPLPDSDPVAKALLAGQDYQGLAIRGGKYNFSTVKFLKEGDGKPWLAYSVRISLENELKRIRQQFGRSSRARPAMPTSFARPMKRDRRIRHAPEVPGQADRRTRRCRADQVGAAPGAGPEERRLPLSLCRCVRHDAGKDRRCRHVAGLGVDGGHRQLARRVPRGKRRHAQHAAPGLCAGGLAAGNGGVHPGQFPPALAEADGAGCRALAGGDLRTVIHSAEADSRNEVHVIGCAFNHMAENMRSLVQGVASTSTQVGVAADELQEAAHAARESSGQASTSASGIAASVEQLSVSITHVATTPTRRPRFPKRPRRSPPPDAMSCIAP
jgi:hypothetical protein